MTREYNFLLNKYNELDTRTHEEHETLDEVNALLKKYNISMESSIILHKDNIGNVKLGVEQTQGVSLVTQPQPPKKSHLVVQKKLRLDDNATITASNFIFDESSDNNNDLESSSRIRKIPTRLEMKTDNENVIFGCFLYTHITDIAPQK